MHVMLKLCCMSCFQLLNFNVNIICGFCFFFSTLLLPNLHLQFHPKEGLISLSEVGQQTAIGHERHDNVGGRASIHTDTNEIHDIGVVELFHLQTFLNDCVDLIPIKESY